MQKEMLKRLLVEQKEEGCPNDLIARELAVHPRRKKANTLVGIRRAGKTYSMFQIMDDLDTGNVFYINLEDERLIHPNLQHLTRLIPTIRETFELEEGPIYLFVDEVQNVPEWEQWARRIAEKPDVYLFISGSSSKVTSEEVATELRGRTLTTYIFPLSFQEFLRFKEFKYDMKRISYSQQRYELKRLFDEYLRFGSFPEIVLEKNEMVKLQILREYFSTIVARDIIERHNVNKIRALKSFMKLLLNNFSRLISFTRAKNWLQSMGLSISKTTLTTYFGYLRSSFFLFDNTIFSRSIKDRLQYPRKIYVIDNGFASALTDRFSTDRGWFFENLVARELYRTTVIYPRKEIFYWKSGDREVDFIVKDNIKVKKLIQVCSDLTPQRKSREVKNLLKASEDVNCDTLYVITDEHAATEERQGKNITYIPLWKWLLQRSSNMKD